MLPPTRPVRFQRAHVMRSVVSSEWRIYLPNGVSVAFFSSVDAITVPEHARKQRGRRKLSESLPRIDAIHELADAERTCPHDGVG
ncbi:MAG TPA: hypothetical protein ENI98_04995 [Gammaproteobacteria bacterium]|nr:hypothetical protein [Gammaproteobacteria bacterium]